MNRADFDKLAMATIARTGEMLIAKGAEYADDSDRLMNFKRNADRNGHTVLEEWMTYWNKHIDSIHSYIKRVRDKATQLALEELITRTVNGADQRHLADPSEFRAAINRWLPVAMQEIDAKLSEPIEGRFDDNINYSILCQAILAELRRS